jgi:carboxypeptidase Q
LGATLLEHRDGGAGADIDPLDEAGVPTLSPLVDTRKYFDYHHSPADTLDKVQAEDIRRQVAVLAVLAYYLAEMPEVLPRLPAGAKSR